MWPQIQLLFENDKKKIEYAKKKQLLQILYTGIAVIFAKIDSLFGKKKGDTTQKAATILFMENSNFAKKFCEMGESWVWWVAK